MINRLRAALFALALVTAGLIGFTPGAAQANAACPSNTVCMYQCNLSQSCGSVYNVPSTYTSCANIWAAHISILSVKNNTGYRFKVYKNSICSGTPGAYFYAHTNGDMNWEWSGDAIASIQRG
jgi:hypothetical protein